MDVAVAAGRIAYVGNADHTIGAQTVVIDATGKYMVPGFLDGHMHVESTMLSVTEFAKAALSKGQRGFSWTRMRLPMCLVQKGSG